jgi:hypothetical protein
MNEWADLFLCSAGPQPRKVSTGSHDVTMEDLTRGHMRPAGTGATRPGVAGSATAPHDRWVRREVWEWQLLPVALIVSAAEHVFSCMPPRVTAVAMGDHVSPCMMLLPRTPRRRARKCTHTHKHTHTSSGLLMGHGESLTYSIMYRPQVVPRGPPGRGRHHATTVRRRAQPQAAARRQQVCAPAMVEAGETCLHA